MTRRLKEDTQADINTGHLDYLNSRLDKVAKLVKRTSAKRSAAWLDQRVNQVVSDKLRQRNDDNKTGLRDLLQQRAQLAKSPDYADRIQAQTMQHHAIEPYADKVTPDTAKELGVRFKKRKLGSEVDANIRDANKYMVAGRNATHSEHLHSKRLERLAKIAQQLELKKGKFLKQVHSSGQRLKNPSLGDAIRSVREQFAPPTKTTKHVKPNSILQDYEQYLNRNLSQAQSNSQALKNRATIAQLKATSATVAHAKSDSKSATAATKFKTLASRLNNMKPVEGDSDSTFKAGMEAGKLKTKIDKMASKIPTKLAKEYDYDFPTLLSKTGKEKRKAGSETAHAGFRTKQQKEYEAQQAISDDALKQARDMVKSHIDRLTTFKKFSNDPSNMPLDMAIDIAKFANKKQSSKSTEPVKPITKLGSYRPTKNDRF